MRVELRFFGPAREAAGRDVITVDLPPGSRLEDAVRAAENAVPGLGSLRGARLRFALNAEYAPESAPLKEGDVVTLIPPVGGG